MLRDNKHPISDRAERRHYLGATDRFLGCQEYPSSETWDRHVDTNLSYSLKCTDVFLCVLHISQLKCFKY